MQRLTRSIWTLFATAVTAAALLVVSSAAPDAAHAVTPTPMAAVAPASATAAELPSALTGRATAHVVRGYSAGDCFAGLTALGGGIAGKSAWGVAAAIVSLFQCGRWLGTYTVDAFCWTTRQWWGWNSRSAMWAASWGRYTRC